MRITKFSLLSLILAFGLTSNLTTPSYGDTKPKKKKVILVAPIVPAPAVAKAPSSFPGAIHSNVMARISATNPQPPQITVEQGAVESLEQAISHIWVTHEYQTLFPDYVTTNADIGKADSDDLNAFIAENVPNSTKFHENDHYELRDPRITEAFIKMKAAGFGGVSIHTDFANIFELGPNDVSTSDFNNLIAQGKFKQQDGKDIDAVVEFKKLLAAGFKVIGSDQKLSKFQGQPGFEYTISGPEVQKLKPDQEGVIFHLKRYLNFYLKNGVITYRNARSGEVNYSLAPNVVFDAQGFATPHSRLNISYEFLDSKIIADMHADHQSQHKVFGDGGTVAQVPATPVRTLQYPEGEITVVNLADFSGQHPEDRFNPNTYVIELIKDAIYTFKIANKIPLDPGYDRPPTDPNKTVSIEEFQMMAYVFTDRNLLEALSRLFVLKTGTKGIFHFEQQFADLDSEGVAALFGGYAINREMGGILEDVAGILSNNPNIQATVNQRRIDGTKVPYLNHGKFIAMKITINGQKFLYIHDLSFNISGHTANAENRMIVLVKMVARFAQESADRLLKIIGIDIKAGHALDMKYGGFRSFLARLTGKDVNDIDPQEATALFKLVDSGQNVSPIDLTKIYDEFVKRVQAIYNLPTSKSILSQAVFDEKLKDIVGWNAFLTNTMGKGAKIMKGFTAQKYVAGADGVAYKGENPLMRRGDLRIALADKPLKDMTLGERIALDAKVDAAAKAEGQTTPLPPIVPKDPNIDTAPKPKAAAAKAVPVATISVPAAKQPTTVVAKCKELAAKLSPTRLLKKKPKSK